MSGFTSGGEGFDRIFMTDYEIVDQFVASGGVWGCGYNTGGGLGDSTTVNKSSLVITSGGGANWKQVSGGFNHTAAVKTDGTLWTWGSNSDGQLGNNSSTFISRSSPGTIAGGGTDWKQVSCGFFNVGAVKTDGTLWTWGSNNVGELGNGTKTPRSSPGTTSGGGTNWKQIACCSDHTAAVKTDGTLWTWGYNFNGQLGDNTVTSRLSPGQTAGLNANWKQVSAGSAHTAAVKTDGTLWTWGSNADGRLGDGTTTSRSSPGTTAGGGTNWKQVAAYFYNTAAIKTDGTLWTWGRNDRGQIGDNTVTNRSSPVTTAGGGTNWKQVSCGYTAAAIKTDGTLWTWGGNFNGQLGNGTTTNRSSPGTVVSNNNWKQVACGAQHTAAIEQ